MSTIEPGTDRSTISINAHCLTYPPISGVRRSIGRRLFAKALPLAAAMVVLAAGTMLLSIRAAGAQQTDAGDGADGGVSKLKSVQFDLEDSANNADDPLQAAGAAREARYREVVVTHTGVTTEPTDLRLRPLPGLVRVTLSEQHSRAMTADINGREIGFGADDFADSLADAISSGSVHRHARLAATEGGEPLSVDVFYSRPLTTSDHVLVQEGGGNGNVRIQAINAEGSAIGTAVDFGPGYQWNTGHGVVPGVTSWASVLPVADLGVSDQSVAGIRLTGAYVEVKAVALGPIIDSPLPPPPGTEVVTEPAPTEQPPLYAAVGLEASIRAAIAVDGAGCTTPDPASASAPAAGAAATFCFIVTNLGRTGLTDVTFSDERLGLLDAVLPRANGPAVLQPGERAVYYYHSVIDQRPAGTPSTVKARAVDGDGAPLAGLIDPSGSGSSDGAVIAGAAAGAGPQVGGKLIEAETPPVMAAAEQPQAQQSTAQPAQPQQPSAQQPAARPPTAQQAPQTTEGVAATTTGDELVETVAVTQLAHTGTVTEPWVLVILSMGLIFIGYTLYAAFQRRPHHDEPCGHDQLDSLGFD